MTKLHNRNTKNSQKVLHVCNDPKFTVDLFRFLHDKGFDLSNHHLFHYRCDRDCKDFPWIEATFSKSFFSLGPNIKLLQLLLKADRVFIHGLASPYLIFYLALLPVLGKKSFWCLWGKDLYFFRQLKRKNLGHYVYELLRKLAIKNIRHFVTNPQGEYELARKWYGLRAEFHRSFLYPSNLYKDVTTGGSQGVKQSAPKPVTILAGNSADTSNKHKEIFEILARFSGQEIKVISPLSYGDEKYAEEVANLGKKVFGEKFIPLTSLLSRTEYYELLEGVDIAIFNHGRQQAMGNITTLLGMGKKVYLRRDISTWGFFEDIGVKLYDVKDFSLDIDEAVGQRNSKIIREHFSEENLVKQWRMLLEADL